MHHLKMGSLWYAAAIGDGKIFAIAFSKTEKGVLQELLESLPHNMPFQMAEKSSSLSAELLKTLKAIFDGKDVSLRFKVAMGHMPSYTRRVLECTSMIPVGYLTTYGAIARAVGGSPRAVGNAMAYNPFPLLIPCHRVVRADFSVGGYGGGFGVGVKIKRELLKRENRGYEEDGKVKINGKTLLLFPVKRLRKD
ncbi:MAG: methylated-DNA--[protein]-cysteine S-methyltransferase [Candidatus Bathyarchaeota archaeon]|nr:MAG: methylated-DNA--[protein]-cysteine S-methyltransferase [Candidatus Bathyarchaeota archaeon]